MIECNYLGSINYDTTKEGDDSHTPSKSPPGSPMWDILRHSEYPKIDQINHKSKVQKAYNQKVSFYMNFMIFRVFLSTSTTKWKLKISYKVLKS